MNRRSLRPPAIVLLSSLFLSLLCFSPLDGLFSVVFKNIFPVGSSRPLLLSTIFIYLIDCVSINDQSGFHAIFPFDISSLLLYEFLPVSFHDPYLFFPEISLVRSASRHCILILSLLCIPYLISCLSIQNMQEISCISSHQYSAVPALQLSVLTAKQQKN